MKIQGTIFLCILFIFSCQQMEEKNFSPEALQQTLYTRTGEPTTVQQVIKEHEGRPLLIDVWASWCGDCARSFPKIAEIQEQYPDMGYVFLSVDEQEVQWKDGITKYEKLFDITGDHYFFNTGWKKDGDNLFINDIDLQWIPRFMLINPDGSIEVYNAEKADDSRLLNAIERLNQPAETDTIVR